MRKRQGCREREMGAKGERGNERERKDGREREGGGGTKGEGGGGVSLLLQRVVEEADSEEQRWS